jgi:hypothetical protein
MIDLAPSLEPSLAQSPGFLALSPIGHSAIQAGFVLAAPGLGPLPECGRGPNIEESSIALLIRFTQVFSLPGNKYALSLSRLGQRRGFAFALTL